MDNRVRKRTHAHLIADSNQFDTVRRNKAIAALESISDQPHKPENVIQRMSGYDTTPHGRREIKYTRCIKIHIDLIRAELEFRGVRFEMGTGII